MIRIRDKYLKTLAYIQKSINPLVEEEINRGFTFAFSTVMDGIKSQYVHYDNIVEVEDNYFNISYFKKKRNKDGTLIINVACEHVSYNLNDPEYNLEFFTVDGTPTQILTELLEGTPFTVGTVEFIDQEVFSIQEKASRRAILVLLAEYLGGELKFDKYEISILQRRGSHTGVQFRVGKNIEGIEKEVDAREKINGLPRIAYDVDVVELSPLPEYGKLEKFQLGDTIGIIDKDLQIKTDVRIVKYARNPVTKRNSRVEIQNFIEDIADSINKIERNTIIKEKVYNGIRIGPDNGFVAERSDKKARTVMNATEGIKIQQGDGEGNYEDKFFADTEGNLNLEGNIFMNDGFISWDNVNSDPATDEARETAEAIAEGTYFGGTFIDGTTIFSPTIGAGSFIGGDIDIGNGTFSVDSGGNMEATSAYIQGFIEASDFIGGYIDIGNGNFEVLNDGTMYASNAFIEGEIWGSEIYGSDIFGSNIFGGQIDVSTDLYVGRNIFLEEGTDNNKRIEFTDRNGGAFIEYFGGGDLNIFSWSELDLAAPFVNIGGSQETFIGASNTDVLFNGRLDMAFANNAILPTNSYIGSQSFDNEIATMGDIDAVYDYIDFLMNQ